MHRLDVRVQAGVLDGERQVRADALERPRAERVEGAGMRVVQHEPAGQVAVEDERHQFSVLEQCPSGIHRLLGLLIDGHGSDSRE